MKTPKTMKKMGPYNASFWQTDENGVAFSVCVVQLVDGKIVRSNAAQCTGFEGTVNYHLYFMARNSRFGGRPVKTFVSQGTDGFIAACGGGIAKVFRSSIVSPIE